MTFLIITIDIVLRFGSRCSPNPSWVHIDLFQRWLNLVCMIKGMWLLMWYHLNPCCLDKIKGAERHQEYSLVAFTTMWALWTVSPLWCPSAMCHFALEPADEGLKGLQAVSWLNPSPFNFGAGCFVSAKKSNTPDIIHFSLYSKHCFLLIQHIYSCYHFKFRGIYYLKSYKCTNKETLWKKNSSDLLIICVVFYVCFLNWQKNWQKTGKSNIVF